MPYNPQQPLDFTYNPATLSEYLSHETNYETQNKPDTCRKDEAPVASGTFEEAVGIDCANTGTATGAVNQTGAGLEANKNGTQLTLF